MRASRFSSNKNKVTDVGGGKTLSTFAAYIYIFNQLSSIFFILPHLIIVSGWLPTLVINYSLSILSAYMGLMMIKSMTLIDGNQLFQLRYEYLATAQNFFSPFFGLLLKIAFNLLSILQFQNINEIASILDKIILEVFHLNFGINLSAKNTSICIAYKDVSMNCNITAGYLICAIIICYLATKNINDNTTAEYTIFSIFCVTAILTLYVITRSILKDIYMVLFNCSIFIANNKLSGILIYMRHSISKILRKRPFPYTFPKAFGKKSYCTLIPLILNNYTTADFAPSLVNECKPTVDIGKVIWNGTLIMSTVCYINGFILATYFPNLYAEDTLLIILMEKASWAAYSISLFQLVSGFSNVVLKCISTRYNLVNTNLYNTTIATYIACSPLIFARFFINNTLTELITFLMSSICHFIIPTCVYYLAMKSPLFYRRNDRFSTLRLHVKAFFVEPTAVIALRSDLRKYIIESGNAESKALLTY